MTIKQVGAIEVTCIENFYQTRIMVITPGKIPQKISREGGIKLGENETEKIDTQIKAMNSRRNTISAVMPRT